MSKLLVLCGPTATGKTNLALSLAKQFNGEIINADSRQVYRGMDIGTGKDISSISHFKFLISHFKTENKNVRIGYHIKNGIPIWLVDVVEPDYVFNVRDYVTLARQVIADIQARGKVPMLVGGTGFYIKALINPPATLHIPINKPLRKRLDEMSVEQLQKELIQLDAHRLEQMNESDKNNPRRLVRAIEVAIFYQERDRHQAVIPASDGRSASRQTRLPRLTVASGIGTIAQRCWTSSSIVLSSSLSKDQHDKLTITLSAPLPDLYCRIDQRVEERYQNGVIDEIRGLLKKGYRWDLPAFSGCGYRVWQPFFEENVAEKEIIQRWKNQEHAYARRQITWFRKQKDIHWFDITEAGYKDRIWKTVEEWYTKNCGCAKRSLADTGG